MISFIVIGKNEGMFLGKCLNSILNITKDYPLLQHEIIYVDSGSNDNSLMIAKNYNIRIFAIEGTSNAAIARNVGAENSIGQDLIFLDGDMELQLNFFDIIIKNGSELKYNYVSGDIFNVYYTFDYTPIGNGFYYGKQLIADRYLPYTGGFICIKKQIWESVGGMRQKYRRSQDLDFGFRLAKKKILLLRKKELGVIHNTISYFDSKRTIKIFKNNDFGYRAMLYRDHILNKYIYYYLLRTDYSMLLLFILILISLFFLNPIFLLPYFFLNVYRTIIHSKTDKSKFFIRLLSLCYKDIQLLYSSIIFYPRKSKYTVKEIN